MGIMLQRWIDEPVDGPSFSVEVELVGDGNGEVYEDLESEHVIVDVQLHTPSSLLFGVGAWVAEEGQEE
jgi:hypothetical protein